MVNGSVVLFYRNIIYGRVGGSSVERLVLAQVMIPRLVSSSPASGSVLTAQNLEPASDSVSHSLSAAPPTPTCALSLKNEC